jgi:hypothetical protein
LRLDARATAEHARAAGMSGIPLGYGVEPVVRIDSARAEDYLARLATRVNIAPYNAGFEWRDDQLMVVSGRAGRSFDIAQTLARLMQSPTDVVSHQRLELITSLLPPEVMDSTPYLEDARQLTSQPFTLTGYDPFRDDSITWTTIREVSTSWLEVRSNGLNLREDTFAPFVEAQNATLHAAEASRFMDPTETLEAMRQAIARGETSTSVRIRYHPTTYMRVGHKPT